MYLIYLAVKSQSGMAPGLVNTKLSPCPSKKNCVCSEYKNDTAHYTAAIKYKNESIEDIIKAIEKLGGEITSSNPTYISAVFSTGIFRYKDDFEIRLDSAQALIHIRSASRVGYSDMGINLQRIAKFKKIYH